MTRCCRVVTHSAYFSSSASAQVHVTFSPTFVLSRFHGCLQVSELLRVVALAFELVGEHRFIRDRSRCLVSWISPPAPRRLFQLGEDLGANDTTDHRDVDGASAQRLLDVCFTRRPLPSRHVLATMRISRSPNAAPSDAEPAAAALGIHRRHLAQARRRPVDESWKVQKNGSLTRPLRTPHA